MIIYKKMVLDKFTDACENPSSRLNYLLDSCEIETKEFTIAIRKSVISKHIISYNDLRTTKLKPIEYVISANMYADLVVLFGTSFREREKKITVSYQRQLGDFMQKSPYQESVNPPLGKEKESGDYEFVNSPAHYNTGGIETIEKMIRIWGKIPVAMWCELTAYKYRERIGSKPTEPIERDMEKIRWYENKAAELRKV